MISILKSMMTSRCATPVRSLALTVARGETFALVGESGSGESMTAMALLRLLPEALRVTRGTIVLEGTELNGLSGGCDAWRARGACRHDFQEPATSLNPVMRIGDQVIEAIAAHTDLRGAQARAR